MAVNREIWKKRFSQNAFPRLPCPHCVQGRLKSVDDSLVIDEPKFSSNNHKNPHFEVDWVEKRFSVRLQCDESNCGEIASAIGDVSYVEVYVEEEDAYSGVALEEFLCVASIFPAPPLFRLPQGLPYEVKHQLRLAFQLFWIDMAACAARVRTSVELMLDEQGIIRERTKKNSLKIDRINLHDRIKLFETHAKGQGASDHLQALRIVGNLGTHEMNIPDDVLFDSIDVLEDVLLEVYEKKSIKAKVEKLKALGKP